jgi:probable F420-dependent oxidoreductase
MDEIGVTFASFTALGADKAVGAAARAAELGYRSFWTAEASGPESFTVLTAAGAAAPGLDLGTGVLPVQLRPPLLVAMSAATLQTLHPDGDVLIGVGMSSPVITERWHGVPYGTAPLARMRSYLTVLRRLLAGESVTVTDEHYALRGAQLGVRLHGRRPKLVLAALNPGMLRLAGELADGVLLNYLPASHVPWSVERVREGEAAAGREPGSCRVYAYVHVGVADPEESRSRARRDIWSYAVVDGYARNFERAGYEAEVAAVRAAMAARDRDAAVAAISDRMADEIDVVGTAADVQATVRAYRDGGVDHPVVMPLPWGPDRLETIEQTMVAACGA